MLRLFKYWPKLGSIFEILNKSLKPKFTSKFKKLLQFLALGRSSFVRMGSNPALGTRRNGLIKKAHQ